MFEQNGEQRWQASEFEGRLEVPGEKLWEGDCSLILRDVQFGDVGLYESFMVVDRTRRKRRVFIQSVHLSVYGKGRSTGQTSAEIVVLYR